MQFVRGLSDPRGDDVGRSDRVRDLTSLGDRRGGGVGLIGDFALVGEVGDGACGEEGGFEIDEEFIGDGGSVEVGG